MIRVAAHMRFVASYLPTIVLSLVVIHHIYQTSTHGLTRWKGGGFGMFTTIDSGYTRFVRLYVTTDQGATFPVELPAEHRAELERARYLPGELATAALADKLLRREWVWADKTTLPGVGVPAPHATSSSPPRIRLAKSQEHALSNAQRVEVQAIRIEILTFSYESNSHQLLARLVKKVESRKKLW
jgi:hypothetical protein